MKKTKHRLGQIIQKLRRAEALSGQGKNIEEICRELGISDVTYYKWREEYGGMDLNQAKKLKKLKVENARLKRMIADLTLQEKILKDAVEGDF